MSVTTQYNDAVGLVAGTTALATPFLISEVEHGPDTAVFIASSTQALRDLGARTALTAALHDDIADHFARGGGPLWVRPLKGPSATKATTTFVDSTGTVALTASGVNTGAYYRRVAVDIDTAAGSPATFTVFVLLDGKPISQGGPFITTSDAQAWSQTKASGGAVGRLVDLKAGLGTTPVATPSAVALTTGGTDDFANIGADQIRAAAASFDYDKGPGCVRLPGRTALSSQQAAIAGAFTPDADGNVPSARYFRATLPAITDVNALVSQYLALQATGYGDRIDVVGDRIQVPGLTAAAPSRNGDPGAGLLGVEAANDQRGVSPNQPAAGPRFGTDPIATGVQIGYQGADRKTLLDAGIVLPVVQDGSVVYQGGATAADGSVYPQAVRRGSMRLRVAIHQIAVREARLAESVEVNDDGTELRNLEATVAAAITAYWARSFRTLTVVADLIDHPTKVGLSLLTLDVSFNPTKDASGGVQVTIAREV